MKKNNSTITITVKVRKFQMPTPSHLLESDLPSENHKQRWNDTCNMKIAGAEQNKKEK